MIGRNIAPGMNRTFAAAEWPTIDPALQDRALQEARDLADMSRKLHITGTDIDAEQIELAELHAREAGIGDDAAA